MIIEMKRAACAALAVLPALFTSPGALAHGGSAGDVSVGHPYATPSVPGTSNGVAYIAKLENTGKQPDRLLRVSTTVAARTEMHTMSVEGGVMRMREVADIPLVPGAPIKMRPGQGLHFMLIGLKHPLKEGDSFLMTMEFERGGKVEVKVVVVVPTAHAQETAGQQH